MSLPLLIKSAYLIVCASALTPASLSLSIALRVFLLPSSGLLTSVSSTTSLAILGPNSLVTSVGVTLVSSTVSCNKAAACCSTVPPACFTMFLTSSK